jgi:hypothetical protein
LNRLIREVQARMVAPNASNDCDCGEKASFLPVEPKQQLPTPLRRRARVARIGLHAREFGLSPVLDGVIAANGHHSLGGFADGELIALESWLDAHIDRLQHHCEDPRVPPAS